MGSSKARKDEDSYSEAETKARFDAILRGAFSTSPKPMKEIPRKREKVKRARKRKASAPKSS